jgi:hypothetical protein
LWQIFSFRRKFCLLSLLPEKRKSYQKFVPFCQKKSQFIISQKGAKAIYQFLLNLKRQVYFLEKENKKIIKKFNERKTK